ncbi:hypothetical protein [Streptomyces gobiensis]|uniref:hypothetical protein n=1 Tax=Streptomyces gobiensis TaxID=2875706 RepID=UPI001E507AFA|nr:hypothetical protein [Streptomyces gobiensis]UGY95326.1 hypothetical protein test1122_13760 [Streptomyces gobiensis]
MLSGLRPYLAAAVQTGLLVALNTGGLLFSGGNIEELGRMLTANLARRADLARRRAAQRHAEPAAGRDMTGMRG